MACSRTITLIVVHCTATPAGRDYTIQDVDRWHRERGWKMVGYHYLIRLDGTIERGRPEEMVGAHCQGHNKHSIGICYVGGLISPLRQGEPERVSDTRTPAQKAAMHALLRDLKRTYPHALIVGHHDLNPHKSCPNFNAAHEYKSLQPN